MLQSFHPRVAVHIKNARPLLINQRRKKPASFFKNANFIAPWGSLTPELKLSLKNDKNNPEIWITDRQSWTYASAAFVLAGRRLYQADHLLACGLNDSNIKG